MTPSTVIRRPQDLSLLVLGVGIVVAALAVVWLLVGRGSTATHAARDGGPKIVSQAQLERFAGSLDYPVYWAGPKPGYSYELTSSPARVWVRYLPSGVKAGDPRPNFLVVGTYKLSDAFAGLERIAKSSTSVSRSIRDGGLLVYDAQRPTSAYFSYPGVKYQVEVYARSPQTSRSLIVGRKVEPVR